MAQMGPSYAMLGSYFAPFKKRLYYFNILLNSKSKCVHVLYVLVIFKYLKMKFESSRIASCNSKRSLFV